MPQVISENANKGGVSVLLFHCLFNEGGSITHFMHDFDSELYRSLPHLYMVCIAEPTNKCKKLAGGLAGGFVIKTSYTHNDHDFLATLTNTVSVEPRLKNLISSRSSFLPAHLGAPGDAPITEAEMLRAMMTQALKHGAAGVA